MEAWQIQILMLVAGIYGTLTTGFIGWVAITTWKASTKVATFEVQFTAVAKNMDQMAKDVGEMRKFDGMLAVHAVQIAGIDRRLTDMEHRPAPLSFRTKRP